MSHSPCVCLSVCVCVCVLQWGVIIIFYVLLYIHNREALTDIFEMCDLDGNGYLNRSEFNYFNLRTSGEEVTDKEWEVVESKLWLKHEIVQIRKDTVLK